MSTTTTHKLVVDIGLCKARQVSASSILATPMSSTKVYTDTREDRAASTGSLSLRGRSPHLLQDGNGARKSFEKGGDIELAQLGVIADGAQSGQPSTGKTSPSPVFDPAHPSAEEKWKARIQLAACCSTLFLAGWNDGTTGPLLPRIQANYHVSLREYRQILSFVACRSADNRCRSATLLFL